MHTSYIPILNFIGKTGLEGSNFTREIIIHERDG
jgi:hypothetical protein